MPRSSTSRTRSSTSDDVFPALFEPINIDNFFLYFWTKLQDDATSPKSLTRTRSLSYYLEQHVWAEAGRLGECVKDDMTLLGLQPEMDNIQGCVE